MARRKKASAPLRKSRGKRPPQSDETADAESLAGLEQRLRDAEATGDPYHAFEARLGMAGLLINKDPEQAIAQAMETVSILEAVQDPGLQTEGWIRLLEFLYRMEAREQAAALLDPAEKIARMMDVNFPENQSRLLNFLKLKHQILMQASSSEAAHDVAAEIERLEQQQKKTDPDEFAKTSHHKPSAGEASPPPKIVSDLWTQEDHLGYASYARALATLITHPDTSPPLTIGIKAPWGSGKTSLMRMVQELLDGDMQKTDLAGERNRLSHAQKAKTAARNGDGKEEPAQGKTTRLTYRDLLKFLEKPPPATFKIQPRRNPGAKFGIGARATVWFNAWKYQSSEQIWAGLAHAIITQVTERLSPIERERFWLRLHIRRINPYEIRRSVYRIILEKVIPVIIGGVGLALFLMLLAWIFPSESGWIGHVPAFLGFGSLLSAAAAGYKGYSLFRSQMQKALEGSFQTLIREPDYEGRLGFLHLVESDIREVLNLVATPKQPLVIFIDDLDRCAPRHVAEVVEAINLFLAGDFPNCIFVIGMEPEIVAAALEVANRDLIEKFQDFHLSNDHTPIGWRFMEKIIQLPLTLPPPTPEGLNNYVRFLVTHAEQGRSPATRKVAHTKPQEKPTDRDIREFEKQLEGSADIAQLRANAEELVRKETDPARKQAAAEAGKRQFARQIRESDPAVQAFVQKAALEFQANPRKLKRYINLFQFLCTLRHNLRLDYLARGEHASQLPPDEVLTKFVILCVRWPQALGLLSGANGAKQEPDSFGSLSLLAQLEARARSLVLSSNTEKTRLEEWKAFIESIGVTQEDWMVEEDFLTFLAGGQELSPYENCGLW